MTTVVMLPIVGMARITAAQTGEEGVANFYGDQFQKLPDVAAHAAEKRDFVKRGKAKVRLEVRK